MMELFDRVLLMCAAVISTSVVISVETSSEPAFAEPIPNVTVSTGQNISLPCVVDNLGSFRVAWIHTDRYSLLTLGDRVITRNFRYKVTNSGRTWWLHIVDVQEGDRGEYMCQINTTPKKIQAGYIEVVVPKSSEPKFAEPIPNITVSVGQNVSLPCVVDNLKPFKVAWIHTDSHSLLTLGDRVITRDFRYKVINSGRTWVLHIANVQEGDRGEYMCRISTTPMKAQIGTLEVVVANSFEPEFAEPIPNVTVSVGRNATLTCVVDNLEPFKVAWIHADRHCVLTLGDSVITRNPRYKVINSGRIWLLHIADVQEGDRGEYLCQISTTPMKAQIGTLEVVGSTEIPYVPTPVFNPSSEDYLPATNSNTEPGSTDIPDVPLPFFNPSSEDYLPATNFNTEPGADTTSSVSGISTSAYFCYALFFVLRRVDLLLVS